MGKEKKRNGGGGMFEVNMTPLIDVSLVLVLILLVATPLALESSIAVRKAERTAARAEKKTDDNRVEVRVVSADTVRVNRVAVAREHLVETLKPLMGVDFRPLVVIECADGVTHGTFVDVLDRAKIAGATEIAIAGETKPSTVELSLPSAEPTATR